MKWLKITGGVVLGIILIVVVGGFLISPEWSVTRSVVINADAAAIHPHVNSLKAWEAWSPFEKSDPSIKITYGDQVEGVGASRSWTSDQGPGTQTIKTSDPAKGITFEVTMEGFNPIEGIVVYEKVEGGTKVTWTDQGNTGGNPFFRWFGLMMEGMLGPMLESGLTDLKAAAEASGG